MTIFLLVLSFIIDGVLIIGLFTLMTKIKKTEELELRQNEVAREIEDLFTSYLTEIKEENQKMSEMLKADSQPEHRSYSFTAHSRSSGLEAEGYTPPSIPRRTRDVQEEYVPPVSNRSRDVQEEYVPPTSNRPRDVQEEYTPPTPKRPRNIQGESPASEYSPPEPEQMGGYQPSIQSQIMDMKNRGYSIDEIAKKLDRGKTEVELLLKFHQKNL
ncbi:hypothetical protein LCL89_04465 [Halobacillus yeomjeoni]|uniref:hypothetical protein n=1 Tax=Halobacillus yeomjeoni TaxID=311194 RepID=UPI001CD20D03|nr:hypothetical protein [Halobacillus yeomjeoni]MCA0983301.1 hypothetical protein [Halobacillus yeomjeoni]